MSYKIGQEFKKHDAEGTPAHILAHAILGAAVAAAGDNNALVGAISAGGAEAAVPYISKWLYDKEKGSDLTAEEKETVSAITNLLGTATGVAIGDTTANAVQGSLNAQSAVENNSLYVDKNGVVIRNIPNDDYNIYQYDYVCYPIARNNCPNLTDFDELYNSPKKVVGQVMWQDSFTSPESGKSFGIIHFGENIEPYIYQLNDKAWGQWDTITNKP